VSIDVEVDFQNNVYMALSIKDPEADRLARELSKRTGESITETVVIALRERLARQRRQTSADGRREKLRSLRESMRELRVQDARSPDAILGYDDAGLPS
jgi:antitoxin VapB